MCKHRNPPDEHVGKDVQDEQSDLSRLVFSELEVRKSESSCWLVTWFEPIARRSLVFNVVTALKSELRLTQAVQGGWRLHRQTVASVKMKWREIFGLLVSSVSLCSTTGSKVQGLKLVEVERICIQITKPSNLQRNVQTGSEHTRRCV